jgi:hypothetical protein
VIFITHYSDKVTSEIVERSVDSLRSNKFIHLIADQESSLKSELLNFALSRIEPELDDDDFLSVYDCDSLPALRAFYYIDFYQSNCTINTQKNVVFQQSPFYPIIQIQNLFSMIAQSRAIHSLNYHYTAELTSYFKSERFNPIRMSIHLTGHGEHIKFSALKEAGGFCPPSCDSSLGFALSYRNIPIIPIPIPDMSQSPETIADMYLQGLRWYNGCNLYLREFKKNQPTLKVYILAILSFLNNLRWFLFPPICLISIFLTLSIYKSTLSCSVIAIFGTLVFIRHCVLFLSYKQLYQFGNQAIHIKLPSFLIWSTYYFICYLVMRLIWSIPPWHYYILKLLDKPIAITSTPKKEKDF